MRKAFCLGAASNIVVLHAKGGIGRDAGVGRIKRLIVRGCREVAHVYVGVQLGHGEWQADS